MSIVLTELEPLARFTTESGAKKSLEAYHKAKLELKEITARLTGWRDDLIGWAEVNGNFESTSAQIVDTTYQPTGTGWSALLVEEAKGNPELAAIIKTAKDDAKSKQLPNKRVDQK